MLSDPLFLIEMKTFVNFKKVKKLKGAKDLYQPVARPQEFTFGTQPIRGSLNFTCIGPFSL